MIERLSALFGRLVLLLGLFGGPYLIWGSVERLWTESSIQRQGKLVPGVISQVSPTDQLGRRNKGFRLYVRFETERGPQTAWFDVIEDYGRRKSPDGIRITDPHCEVRYLPSDPSKALIIGASASDWLTIPLGALWFLGGVGAAICTWNKWRVQRVEP